jgi:plastocyanin
MTKVFKYLTDKVSVEKSMKNLIFLFIFALLPINTSAEEGEVFKEKKFKKPLREYSIIATDKGYYPEKVFAYVGEKVKFFLTSTTDKPQCFLVKDHSIFLGAKKGKVSEGEVSFYTPGRFEFYCPSNSFKGHITVIQRASDKQKEASREVASKKPDYWIPRDYD